jgi:hypothetical protein
MSAGLVMLPKALQPLRAQPRWVMWKSEVVKGRKTKVPRVSQSQKASSTDSTTWRAFDELPSTAGFDGHGLVLGQSVQGADLDVCLGPDGALEEWAADVVARLDTYTEVSPSGRGLKCFFHGPEGDSKEVSFGDEEDLGAGVLKRRELAYYTGKRYFTVTGRVWADKPLRQITDSDAAWLRERIEEIRTGKTAKPTQQRELPEADAPHATGPADLHPDLLRKIREPATGDRSAEFHHAVCWAADEGLTADQITELIGQHPAGVGAKYAGRLAAEVARCLTKRKEQQPRPGPQEGADDDAGADLDDDTSAALPAALFEFYAHMPSHQYLFVPTRELWPAQSVNGRVPWVKVMVKGKPKTVPPTRWLDKRRAVVQMAWHPAEPQIIEDRVLQVSGWARHAGARVFNLYRAPERPAGDPGQAGPWVEHLARVYPDDAGHITKWLAHRIQQPGDKCNHALVLGGLQGIGKDTLLEPLKAGIGPWNWSDISPVQMLGRFNGWAKAVIVRVNEARDLGDVDRFAFYDHSKVIIAAPPDVLRVDEKHLRETYVANVCGVIITTNHLGDGLYLPADDRRHYVAWSPCSRDDFAPDYWQRIYGWFAAGGIGHVVAYLAALDLSDFDPKAPPHKTPAFWSVVASGDAPESGELRDVIERMGQPSAITLGGLIERARQEKFFDLADELGDRKTRRALPHKLERVGYVPVRNPDSDDGLFRVAGRRQAVYGKRGLPLADQIRAARRVL